MPEDITDEDLKESTEDDETTGDNETTEDKEELQQDEEAPVMPPSDRPENPISYADAIKHVRQLKKQIAKVKDKILRKQMADSAANLARAAYRDIPGHTISAVVEGGSDTAVAQAIYLRKTPGTGTYGDQAVTVASTVTGANPIDIKFWRPEYVDVQVYIKIKPLQGYTNLTPQEISESVTAYINSFGIGDDLPISWLWPAAFSGSAKAGNIPVFSIVDLQASALGEPLDHLDIITAYNQVVRAAVSDVTVEGVSA